MPHTRASLALVLAGLSLGACADDRACPTVDPSECDYTTVTCQRQVFATTACMRGESGAHMPAIRAINRDTYAEELRADADSDEDTFDNKVWAKAFSLYGLIPKAQSLEAAHIEESVRSVAAYYSRETKSVTIIVDSDSTRPLSVLSHEFVHALQDRNDGLDGLYDEHGTSSDAVAALKCLTEGEAVLIQNLSELYFGSTSTHDVDWADYFARWRAMVLQDIQDAPSPLLAARALVYPVGGAALRNIHAHAGMRSVRALFAEPPLTFREWSQYHRAPHGPAPLACLAPAPPEGFALKYLDRQGMTGLLSLYTALEQPASYASSTAWRGDSFAVYADPDEVSEEVLVAWRVRLDSAQEASALAELTQRSSLGIEATADGVEVLLTAASDPALLAGWSERGTCTEPEPSALHRQRRLPRALLEWRHEKHAH